MGHSRKKFGDNHNSQTSTNHDPEVKRDEKKPVNPLLTEKDIALLSAMQPLLSETGRKIIAVIVGFGSLVGNGPNFDLKNALSALIAVKETTSDKKDSSATEQNSFAKLDPEDLQNLLPTLLKLTSNTDLNETVTSKLSSVIAQLSETKTN